MDALHAHQHSTEVSTASLDSLPKCFLVKLLGHPHRLLRRLPDQVLGEQLDRPLNEQQRGEDGADAADPDIRGDLDKLKCAQL